MMGKDAGSLERNVGRALAWGAALGALYAALSLVVGLLWPRLAAGMWRDEAPPVELGLLAAGVAALGGDLWDRRLLFVLALVAPLVGRPFGMQGSWALAAGGAAVGALLVHARGCELSARDGARALPAWTYAAGAALTAALTVAGTVVSRTLCGHALDVHMPALLLGAVGTGSVALFVSLGGAGALVGGNEDGVETRGHALLARLRGTLRELVGRGLELRRQCLTLLRTLPAEPGRDALAKVLAELSEEGLGLAEEWSKLEALLSGVEAAQLPTQVAALEMEAANAKDELAREQLIAAAAGLREQLHQVDGLAARRERIMAKLRAHVALLESTRLSLTAWSSSVTQLKVADLSVLAEQLGGLVRRHGAQAEDNDQLTVATMATVSAHAKPRQQVR